MMKMNKKGISLIVLVITTIVVVILASAVILNITNNGVVENAKKAKFMSDFRSVEEGVSLYSVSNLIMDPTKIQLPLEGKLSLAEKKTISDEVPTLRYKIEELSEGKTIDGLDLYWIAEPQIGVQSLSKEKKEKGYIMDVTTGQIYDYLGDVFENKRWHTLDSGVDETIAKANVQEGKEVWNGWIRLTLYYPKDVTDKKWRLGTQGELRADPMSMWQDYTGPITIPLYRTQDLWISYKQNGQEVVIPPAGKLLVDIVPDSTGTTKVSKVNVKINYDEEATTKEYKINDSGWIAYTGQFTVTENCIVEARANKTENIYNTDGSIKSSRNIVGSDMVYIGNIGPEETKIQTKVLPAPTITRLEAQSADEKAKVKVDYPEDAVKKVYKVNYELEQNYTSEVSIKYWGTNVIAYYYDADGNISEISSIIINDTSSGQTPNVPELYNPMPPYEPGMPLPQTTVNTDTSLPAPTITRLAPQDVNEKASVRIEYPEEAVKKVYTVDNGPEIEYTGDIKVSEFGKTITAYYYDEEGNKFRQEQIFIGENPTAPIVLPVYKPQSVAEKPVIDIPISTGIVNQVTVTVTPPVPANKIYIKIGKNGEYNEYIAPVTVNENTEVYTYYEAVTGETSIPATTKISNIKQGNKPYLSIDANPYPWPGAKGAQDVTITLNYSDATKVEYSEDGIVYQIYTVPFKVTKNERIYARATNTYGVTESYLDITNIGVGEAGAQSDIQSVPKSLKKLSVSINANPDPAITQGKVAKVTISIEYDANATEKLYSIGKYGEVKTYTGPFEVTSNCTIYAYAKAENALGKAAKTIDNLLNGISDPIISTNPAEGITASKVMIDIEYDKYATVKKYSIDGGTLQNYTENFEITTNGTKIYAYSENTAGQKSEAYYIIQNIVPEPPVLLLDKGSYYLLKLNYPSGSKDREYKWKENGEWAAYKEEGILLIKSQYKDEVLKDGILIKIEDENGNKVDFKGDYYVLDVPISELFENLSMRWDKTIPKAPLINIDPTTTTKSVTATITYEDNLVKKQYRILDSEGTLGDWIDYTGPITIDRNNTVIYAKGIDFTDVSSQEGKFKVTNIDEVSPVINVTADLTTIKRQVPITVNVTDNFEVANVKGAQGLQGENYFKILGTQIANNSLVNITENGYYTLYAEDGVGNTQIYTLNVTNIDLTIPENPTIASNPTSWTNGNVTVTITYSADSAIKEYSTNGTTWQTYTSALAITTNNTIVYARAKDSAGNQSGQSTLTITNIDKTAPTVVYGTNGGLSSQATTSVTLDDIISGLDSSTLQYVWDTQNMTPPVVGWSMFMNGETLTKSEIGNYYLWIKASDNAGNSIIDRTNQFIFNESGEVVSTITTYNKTFSGVTAGYAYNNPVIPAGFAAVNTIDAKWENLSTDWDKGLVIQDTSGNQFVWVPVDGINVPYAKWCTSGYSYTGTSDLTTPSGFSVTNITTKYQGFYIARYEAMFNYNGGAVRAASKKSANKSIVYMNKDSAFNGYLWNYINITNAKYYSENMDSSYGYDTTKVGTNLITGAEWDTTMKWIQNSGYSVTYSRAWGNYSNSITPANVSGYASLQISGYSNNWKAKNIYDLAGNTREWINESTTNGYYIYRGGSFGSSVPASYRYYSGYSPRDGEQEGDLTFRVSLYIIPMTNPTMSASPTVWTNGNITVTVTYPTQSLSNEYSLDGTIWYDYTSPIIVDSNSTVYTRAIGDGGETTQSTLTITKIDKLAPIVTYGTNGDTQYTQASTTVTVNDAGSSLNAATLQYLWDTQNTTTPTAGWTAFTNGATLTKIGDGTYYLWVKATDNVGNTVIEKSNVFMVGDFSTVVSTMQTENKTFVGDTTGFSYNNPVIPAGFVAVDTDDASWNNLSVDWDKGLVIQDSSSNQFVWVPVDGTNVSYAKYYYINNTTTNSLPTGISSESNQITKYQGFYIGRYETGTGSVIKRHAPVWNYITYTNSKYYAELMYNTTSVKSGLVTGKQWDTTMKWIQNSGKNVTTDSGDWGNYWRTLYPAGYFNNWKAKNIYDLAGNLFEWTNETYYGASPYYPLARGGSFDCSSSTYPAAGGSNQPASVSDIAFGFRIVLYVL